jgi:hypothetical protein
MFNLLNVNVAERVGDERPSCSDLMFLPVLCGRAFTAKVKDLCCSWFDAPRGLGQSGGQNTEPD